MKKTLSFLAAALVCTAMSAQVVFSENFDGVTLNQSTRVGPMPAGWTLYGDGVANYSGAQQNYTAYGDSWAVGAPMSHGNGTQQAVSISWLTQAVACNRWMVTPAIALPSSIPGGGVLTFTFNAYSQDTNYTEDLMVLVSTTGTAKNDFTDTLYNSNIGKSLNFSRDLGSYAGQTIYIAFVNVSNDKFILLLDDVKVEVLLPNNLETAAVLAPLFADANSSVQAVVKNTGASALTSFDYTYTINGTAVSNTVSGISVAYGGYHYMNIPLANAGYGALNIEFTASNPNGQAASITSTKTGKTNVANPSATTTRTTLLEHFTTAQCVYCPGGHERLNEAMNGYEDKIAWVSHHSGYGTDDLTIQASYALEVLYGGGTWAPAMSLDRSKAFVASDDPGVVASVSNNVASIRQLFSAATNTPAVATISMSNLNYNAQTRELSVTVSGEFLSGYEFDRLGLNLYLTEDSIVMAQRGVNAAGTQAIELPNYVHNHVLRANITEDIVGDTTAFASNTVAAGTTYSKTYTYTLPASFRPEKCRLVAFLNNFGTSYSRLNVLNACKSNFLTSPQEVSINTVEDVSASIKTYPNPATDMAYITAESTIRSIQVVNVLGQTVVSSDNVNADIVELRANELEPGMYIVTIRTDNGTASQRLTVVR